MRSVRDCSVHFAAIVARGPATFATKQAFPLLGPVFNRPNRTKLAWRSLDHLKASCLVLVRLAHNRRFVGAVLVLFVFIRILIPSASYPPTVS